MYPRQFRILAVLDLGEFKRELQLAIDEDSDGNPELIHALTNYEPARKLLEQTAYETSQQLRKRGAVALPEVIEAFKSKGDGEIGVRGLQGFRRCNGVVELTGRLLAFHYQGDTSALDDPSVVCSGGKINYSTMRGYQTGFLKVPKI